MLLIKRRLIFLLLGMLPLLAFADPLVSAHKKVEGLDSNQLSMLFRKQEYESLLDGFSGHQWTLDSSPADLMMFCSAVVNSGKKIQDYAEYLVMPKYMWQFAIGYVSLIKGELEKTRSIFNEMMNGVGEEKKWGKVGLLEYALWSGSTETMRLVLDREVGVPRNSSSLNKEDYLYYLAYYYYKSGRWGDLIDLLENDGDHFDKVSSLWMRSQYFIVNNRFDDAMHLIAKNGDSYDEDVDMILTKAQIIELQRSPRESAKYLLDQLRLHPTYWSLIEQHAYHLLSQGKLREGISELLRLVENRPFDLFLQVRVANALLHYGETESDGQELRKLIVNISGKLNGSIPFHVLMANIKFYTGHSEDALVELGKIYSLAPSDLDILWSYIVFHEHDHRIGEAINFTELALSKYPNDIDLLLKLVDLYQEAGNWDGVLSVTEKILVNARYVDKSEFDRVKNLSKQALKRRGEIRDQ